MCVWVKSESDPQMEKPHPIPFPQDPKLAVNPKVDSPVDPKPAATLILYRRLGNEMGVLMGTRSTKSGFMPQKIVFPGGGVELEDGLAPCLEKLSPDIHAKTKPLQGPVAEAFGLACIRETYEETGLKVGRDHKVEPKSLGESWMKYLQSGVTPSLEHLRFVGRAETPPHMPRRYDTWFFMADAEQVIVGSKDPIDSAEMTNLSWFRIEYALAQDLPSITRFALLNVYQTLNQKAQTPPPFNARWEADRYQIGCL